MCENILRMHLSGMQIVLYASLLEASSCWRELKQKDSTNILLPALSTTSQLRLTKSIHGVHCGYFAIWGYWQPGFNVATHCIEMAQNYLHQGQCTSTCTAWLLLLLLCCTKCRLVPIQRSHQSDRRKSIYPTKLRHCLCST
jgi:hypothetical protein